MLHYLNDFFVILSPHDNVIIYIRQFNQLYNDLGLRVNYNKNVIRIIADFLSIEFNSILMQTRLSLDKLNKARNIIKNLLKRLSILYRELDSAIGFLLFIAKIIISKRVFFQRFYNVNSRLAAIKCITLDIKANLQ